MPARRFSFYPHSFRQLLAIGFALVAIPSGVALVTSAVAVSTLADRGERAVFEAMIETRGGRRLAEVASTLERNARQFAVLNEPALLDAYQANRQQFIAAAGQLRSAESIGAQRGSLGRLVSTEQEIHAELASPAGTTESRAAAIARFAEIHDLIHALQQASAERIDGEVEALRVTAQTARRVAVAELVAMLPLIVALVVGFTLIIARPIRDLDRSIRLLGRGQFGAPVAVSGPQDLAELGERLEQMRTALVGLEREKNRFLREIAHALKTPLTALREGAELLQHQALGTLNPDQQEVADIMRRNALELQRLIEGLLQYGQAQFGRTALDLAPLSMTELIRDLVAEHGLAWRAKQLRIEPQVAAPPLLLDASKLRAILDNLLSNAIKYSPPGGQIHIAVNHRNKQLVMDVADEGPGIAAEERTRVFDPFVQGRAVATGLVPGSGIGLSIAREHALAHGGSIELRDTGAGACFRLVVPAEPA